MDYNAGYYQNNQNNGTNSDRGGNINSGDPYRTNGYNPHSQHFENNLERIHNDYPSQYVNNPPANNNNYDGGGVYPDNRNGYSNNDPYYSTKLTSPGGSAYDSGYNTPTPYPSSPIKYPNSPAMHGMNPPYPPINPIPARQVPYGGRPTEPYSEGASSKEMQSDYHSMPSSNPGQEKIPSPTSAYSSEPFLDSDHDEQRPKRGGLSKYCCGCGKTCAIICCIIILLIIGIVAAVLLWARPPKVDFLGIIPSPNGLPSYVPSSSGFDFNLGLKIQVDNPNIVGAKFEMIKAIAFYPGHSDPIGGGNKTNVDISANGNTTIDFPFSVNYNKDIDPDFAILFDIAQKCGLTGGAKQKLEIDYKLTLTLKVILITINPSFNKKAMIDCPIQDGKIPNVPGFDLAKAAQAFGGKKKKRELLTDIPKRPILFN